MKRGKAGFHSKYPPQVCKSPVTAIYCCGRGKKTLSEEYTVRLNQTFHVGRDYAYLIQYCSNTQWYLLHDKLNVVVMSMLDVNRNIKIFINMKTLFN